MILAQAIELLQDNDPRGFEVGNAGRGALVYGSVLNASSTQASMLFPVVLHLLPWGNSFAYERRSACSNGLIHLHILQI